MRKLLVISFVALAAGAVGCSRNRCGEPACGCGRGMSLWGGQQGYQSYQQPYQSTGGCCCDPCGGGGAMAPSGMMSAGMMSPAMMSTPVPTQAPCCGQ